MTFYTNVESFGDKILLREFDTTLNRTRKRRVDFNPSLFMPSADPTGWKTIGGDHLKRVEFNGVKDYWDFRKRYRDMEKPMWGDISPIVQFISETYTELEPDISKVRIFNIDIEVDHGDEFPDPEKADREVTSIAMYDNQTNTMLIWALEFEGCMGWHPERFEEGDWNEIRPYLFQYEGFDDEGDMLESFLQYWEKNYPDIITGWFTEGFDIPYIVNRLNRVLGEDTANRLSPWKMVREQQQAFGNQASSAGYRSTYKIVGVAHLDYMKAYKKYSYTPQESYKLDHIAYSELGDRKLSYDEAQNLPALYRTNFQKFIDYNIKDVDIVQRLDDKRGFLRLIISMAYYSKINFDDVASPIRIWDALIYNYLKPMGIQIEPESKAHKSEKYEGAYVKTPVSGRYHWVVSVDLASEYPSLMRGINISPDRFVGETHRQVSVDAFLNKEIDNSELYERDLAIAANGTMFDRRSPGFMSVLLTDLFNGRKADKRAMLRSQELAEAAETKSEKEKHKHDAGLHHTNQYSKKVLLNSAYGALGNEYFRWFDVRLAEAVTHSGQLAIRWAEKAVNTYFNEVLGTKEEDYVIYIDTDSVYVNAEPIVQKFMPGVTDKTKIVDKLDLFFEKKVKVAISNAYDDLYKYMNHREQLMFMDREVIADSAVFCAKKHYFMRVHDSEGIRYATPKIKIMGMGFIKSNIPEFCRNKCKEMVPIALEGTNAEFVAEIDKFRQEFEAAPLEDIACVVGVSNIRKHMTRDGYAKGTPIGSKSAIIYNRLHKEHDLGSKYELALEGGKIKYVFLNKANPLREETVGFIDFLPPEFNLHAHVDRREQFEKTFMSPLNEILTALNWDRKIVSNLFGFFG